MQKRIRILYSIFFIILSYLSLEGQTFRTGLITGAHISKLTGNANDSYNHLGYNVGARIATDIHRQVRISADFLYSRKGNVVSYLLSETTKYENIRLDYVEIPVMISAMDWMDDPDEEKYYRLHFTIGGSFGRLINYKAIDNFGEDVTLQQAFDKTAISVMGGLVYYTSEHFGINLQFHSSFSNIQTTSRTPSMKSRSWTLNIIYMFDNNRR